MDLYWQTISQMRCEDTPPPFPKYPTEICHKLYPDCGSITLYCVLIHHFVIWVGWNADAICGFFAEDNFCAVSHVSFIITYAQILEGFFNISFECKNGIYSTIKHTAKILHKSNNIVNIEVVLCLRYFAVYIYVW